MINHLIHFPVMSEGYGKITWWGLTPADDVLPGSSDEHELIPEGSPINVLLIGSGDLRHILRSLTVKHHREKQPLHFYIIESNLELLARHVLFLTLMVEPNDKVGLREKTELYLELYGNVLIRSHTSHYVKDKASDLIRMITDPDGLMKQILPFVDINLLKFKERDMLEGIFKFWRNSDNKTIDIQQHWNGRLRHYLAQRYDSRNGVFDWDYHMKLHEMVPLIQHKEYLNWRETGISFQLRDDAPYESLNPTLISGHIIASGGNRLQGGYWGDIVSSPYISFGSYSDDKEVLKKVNDKFVKNSQEISELNVKAMINLLTSCYVMPSSNASPDDDYIEEVDPTIGPNGPLLDGSCKIILLPLNSAAEIKKKAKFQKFFDCVYFSNSMVHHISSGIDVIFSDGCTLLCETARFMLDLNKEHKDEYIRKVIGMAEVIGCKLVLDKGADVRDVNMLRFKYNTRNISSS